MKKIFLFFLTAMLTGLLMTTAVAFGDGEVIAAPEGFEWIGPVVGFLTGIPKVGPIVAKVFEVIALVGGVMTVLSVAVMTLLGLPEIAARFAGAHGLAEKIKAFSDKVLPFLKYLSVFNVQKKD